MYGRLPSFVFGFHGCDKSVCESIIKGEIDCLSQSRNDFNWLGNGIYFWENDSLRALEYAQFLKNHPRRNHRKGVWHLVSMGSKGLRAEPRLER